MHDTPWIITPSSALILMSLSVRSVASVPSKYQDSKAMSIIGENANILAGCSLLSPMEQNDDERQPTVFKGRIGESLCQAWENVDIQNRCSVEFCKTISQTSTILNRFLL